MNVDVYNTHIEVYPYSKGDFPVIEKLYTAEARFTGEPFPCGYMIEDGKLYLPRGTSISLLESTCRCNAEHHTESDPVDMMDHNHHSYVDLRDKLQEDTFQFLMNETNPQLSVNNTMGTGKTFVSVYTITKMAKKALIIAPNEGIKQQWIATFHKMFDYKSSDLTNIAGRAVIDAIMEDRVTRDADVYFANHATLRNYIMEHGGYALHEFFKKLRIGIKVYDESHMEFGNIILLDFFTNTERTWYLTATFDRSDKSESKCFKRAFNNVITFGEMESKEAVRKHVIYHVVNFNSRITPAARAKLMGYPGFTAAKYGRYAFLDDPADTAYQVILSLLKKTEQVEGKTIIFIPLIEAVDTVVTKLRKDCPDKSVGAYHSKMDADDKESTLKKDIIVTTIRSCGTGRDIPGLRVAICMEPIASKVQAEQLIGRLRPYAPDKDTYFMDCVSVDIPPLNWWHRARYRKIQTLVKKTIYLNLDQ